MWFGQALDDELFVMPTLDEPGNSYRDAALTNGSSSFAMDLSAPSVPDIDSDPGLNMCGRLPTLACMQRCCLLMPYLMTDQVVLMAGIKEPEVGGGMHVIYGFACMQGPARALCHAGDGH